MPAAEPAPVLVGPVADAALVAALRRALATETDPDVKAWICALLADAE